MRLYWASTSKKSGRRDLNSGLLVRPLYGHFTQVTWDGIAATTSNGQPDYDVRIIRLAR